MVRVLFFDIATRLFASVLITHGEPVSVRSTHSPLTQRHVPQICIHTGNYATVLLSVDLIRFLYSCPITLARHAALLSCFNSYERHFVILVRMRLHYSWI